MRPDHGSPDGAAEQQPDDTRSEQLLHSPTGNRHVAVDAVSDDLPVDGSAPDAASNGAGHPGAERPDASQHDVAVHLAGIESALIDVALQLGLEADRAAARERVIDRQHEDIERLRSVERAGQLRPVVTDLCRLRNDLLRQAETVPGEMTGPQVATLLGSFAGVVEDALERCGVAVLPRGQDAAFVPGQQQVAETVEVDDPRLDGTIAAVVQDGYAEIDGGKVVAPARITLHRAVTSDETGTKEKTDG